MVCAGGVSEGSQLRIPDLADDEVPSPDSLQPCGSHPRVDKVRRSSIVGRCRHS